MSSRGRRGRVHLGHGRTLSKDSAIGKLGQCDSGCSDDEYLCVVVGGRVGGPDMIRGPPVGLL